MYHLGKTWVQVSIDFRKHAARIRRRLTTVIVFVTALFATSPLFADGSSSKKVRCGEQSLQRAIDKARSGSTLVITGKCSDGPFWVDKDLRLIGQGAELSAPTGSGTVLNVGGVTLHMDNLKITANGNGGISVFRSGKVIANQVEVRDAFIAIGVTDLSLLEIYNSHVVDNGAIGIWGLLRSVLRVENTLIENSGAGIHLEGTSSARVASTQIVNGGVGILIERFSEAELTGNTIEGNTLVGVELSEKYSYVFMEDANIIQHNGVDVKCGNRAIVHVIDTQISETKTTDLDGGCSLIENPIF